MEIAAYLSLIAVLIFFLVKSADLVEDAFVLLAKKLNVSPFVIGFVILSVASSLPEISLVFSASYSNVPELSLGNLLGGTIILLTLVIAINAFKHKQIEFKGRFGLSQIFLALLVLVFQILVILDSNLSWFEGLIMLIIYCAFAFYISVHSQTHRAFAQNSQVKAMRISVLLLRSLAGMILLLIFSRLLVEVAIQTAGMLSVPNSLIGLFVLALGTNTPEMMIALRVKNHTQERLAIGNVIGSACVNTGLMGMLGILAPHQIGNLASLVPSLIILGSAILAFALMVWTGKHVTRRESYILFSLYLVLIATEGIIILLH